MKLKFFLIFLILIFSISVVSAGNYSDLQNEIDNSTNVLILNEDYTFDNYDDEVYVVINKNNFTIEGNNHTINANGMAGFFKINGDNVTIKNLNFINSNRSLTYGIEVYNSNLILNNTNFFNNDFEKGSVIFLKNTNLKIYNSILNNSVGNRGLIYSCLSNNLFIDNCIFSNSFAIASTALRSENTKYVFINNSRFINLLSYNSAGALGVKGGNFKIYNSDFINVSSNKDAGAIYADGLYSGGINSLIENCNFINCSSDFGGAIMELGMNFTVINNCNFYNNFAKYNGGAIYLSHTTLYINNCKFNNNYLTSYENISSINKFGNGGALYIDLSNVTIYNSNIMNNLAIVQGGAIYGYDSNINLINTNTSFNSKNNVFGIYGVFLKNFTSYGSNINDTWSLNNTQYAKVVIGSGINITLVNDTIEITNITRFDLRDFGWVTPVKDQLRRGSCWAFASISAIESSLLRKTNVTYDLSENNLQNTILAYNNLGIKKSIDIEEGYSPMSIAYMLSWNGLILEDTDNYDEIGKVSPMYYSPIHIQDVLFINKRKNATDNDEIKKAILKYGALDITYYHVGSCYNEKTYSYYYNGNQTTMNHNVCIVGFDDNYSKDNFLITPPGDGAFIVKNSWGSNWGDDGFFYISYYDTGCCRNDIVAVYLINNTVNYNKNYQVDFSGLGKYESYFNENFKSFNSAINYYGNKFISVGTDSIAAVGTYFNQSGVDYEINVYINGVLKHTQSGISPYFGYSTIKLTQNITVCEGDEIFVSIKSNAIPVSLNTRVHLDKDTSFISEDGVNWIDMYNNQTPVCLKVYTVEYQLNTNNLTKYYGDDSSFVVDIGAVNKTVIFNINGAYYTRITDENGVASLAINLQPGNYNITTYALGKVNVNTVTILSTVEGSDIVKTYKNATKYVAKFLNTDGTLLTNTKVSFNINGVIYYKVTDSNGLASLAINLLPNNYVITTLNPETNEFKSNNVVVLSTVISQDIVKYYRNGTQFVAQFLTSENKALVNTNVTFNINGVFYTRCTNSEGIAKLNINLNAGDYIITAYNPVTGELKSNNIKILPVIIASDIEKTFTEVKSFKAQIVDGSGKPLANQEVLFNINGVIYHKSTDSNGEAYLNINLNIGEYIITTYWNQTSISNKILIKG